MLRTFLRAKLHHLRITQADKEYQGSLTLDEDLMDAVNIAPYEKVLIANLENGERFETYVITGQRGSGVACLNGAAAYKGKIGDRVIVMVWCQLEEHEIPHFHPMGVRLDENNRIIAAAR